MSIFVSARWVARNLALLTLLGAVAACIHPPLLLVFKQSFLWFFAATMFAVGVVLEPDELGETLRSPGQIGLGLATRFTVMPLPGFMAVVLAPWLTLSHRRLWQPCSRSAGAVTGTRTFTAGHRPAGSPVCRVVHFDGRRCQCLVATKSRRNPTIVRRLLAGFSHCTSLSTRCPLLLF